MSFYSFSFLLYFLPAVLLCWYLLPKGHSSLRLGLLLVCSALFAFAVQPKCLLLLAACTLLCCFAARLMEKCSAKNGKKTVLVLSTGLLLALLVHYKAFAAADAGAAVPVGTSFVVFTAVSYLADCYRGCLTAERNVAKLGLYVSFFPKLTQGPLTRYGEWTLPEKPDLAAAYAGAERFVVGLGKKVLLASAMAQIADAVFSSNRLGTLAAWLGAIAFALQLFFDFAGYTDMAIGIGGMLGVRLPENFRYPYTAQSVTDFWRRWHTSLSRWFRDYLYIPLGGNRKGKARQVLNLFLVWLATGLWHGFTLNFVVWGLWFAVLLTLEKLLFGKVLEKLPPFFRSVYTLLVVLVSWVLFRTDSLAAAGKYLAAMFTKNPSENVLFTLKQYGAELLLCGILSTALGKKLFDALEKTAVGRAVKAAFLLLVFALCILEINGTSLHAFLYAQF